jgi:nucleotide-binding universal stress UspA family protein
VAAKQPKYQYRSLIPEPEIKVTNSSGETMKSSKSVVHPNTSYDQGGGSADAAWGDSDEEADMDDIKRAQNLSFSMTNIQSMPDSHRAIRIIYRGDYNKIAQAAVEEHHRLRKYLVATDLSDESTHALEWAIGTVLRDGDTLIAIYCVDEETGISDAGLVPDDPKHMREQAAALASVSSVSDFKRPSVFHLRGESSTPGTPSGSPAPHGRGERSKSEEERHRAVKDITDRVLRLLRKTRLQVRVVVEVLHCKNPKHLITEVIDLVSPTLVVIGSRGRSALKGVILGSFSNYLVTKSSVPVMVARKRLRKQSKFKRTAVRQVNNLSNPAAKSLAMAKID